MTAPMLTLLADSAVGRAPARHSRPVAQTDGRLKPALPIEPPARRGMLRHPVGRASARQYWSVSPTADRMNPALPNVCTA